MMQVFSYNHLSIVSLLVLYLLPCFFTAIAVLLSDDRLVYLLCFGKAFLFAYVAALFLRCFGSCGWLIWAMVLSPELMMLTLLWFFWLRAGELEQRYRVCFAWLLMAFGFLLCSMIYRVISPFSASILDNVSRKIC